MELYFSPMACSMATRIALYEAGATARFTEVDLKRQVTDRGEPYGALNPLGQVPLLRTEGGELLTENAAILQFVAERFPDARLAPATGAERDRLRQWLCFIATELHKGIFTPLLDRMASEPVRQYVLEKAGSRLAVLERHLAERAFLLEDFSVADGYLFTVLSWAQVTPVRLDPYPALVRYLERLRQRPSVSRALAEELAMYLGKS